MLFATRSICMVLRLNYADSYCPRAVLHKAIENDQIAESTP